jgi:hypothetical protein
MSLAAAVSPAESPRFVEFTDISLIDGPSGGFYFIEAINFGAKQKLYLRIDQKWEELIAPELHALNAEHPASFCVVMDPRIKKPNHFRIDLDYYRARLKEEALEVAEEAAWADEAASSTWRPLTEVERMGQLKSITVNVPIEVHATLRELQKRQSRYSRFSDFASALLCKSTELAALS